MVNELTALRDKGEITEAEIVRVVQETYGVGEVDANFIIAVERGELPGDVITLEPGEELPE